MSDTLREMLLQIDMDLLADDGFIPKYRIDNIVILAQLHCLPSLIPLIERMIYHEGIKPSKIVLIPKCYSTIPSVLEHLNQLGIQLVDECRYFQPGNYDSPSFQMLQIGCRKAYALCRTIQRLGHNPRLVIVDDGGLLTKNWRKMDSPKSIDAISVQVTASGLWQEPNTEKITKINIGQSAAKKFFESVIISRGVLRKVRSLELLRNVNSVGVLGAGALGKALASDCVQNGFYVFFHDIDKDVNIKGAQNCSSKDIFLRKSQIIFGCTGKNSLKSADLMKAKLRESKHFISCSSRDVEFKEILHHVKREGDAFSTKSLAVDNTTHYVENGGFPINFDRIAEQEEPAEIALTRALVLAGIAQAICIDTRRKYKESIKLSPQIQNHVVTLWLRELSMRSEDFGVDKSSLNNPAWWDHNSEGCLLTGENVRYSWALPSKPEPARAVSLSPTFRS